MKYPLMLMMLCLLASTSLMASPIINFDSSTLSTDQGANIDVNEPIACVFDGHVFTIGGEVNTGEERRLFHDYQGAVCGEWHALPFRPIVAEGVGYDVSPHISKVAEVVPVPEPSTVMFVATGLAFRFRKQRN